MSRVISIDTRGLTKDQKETAAMFERELRHASVTKLEIWNEQGEHKEQDKVEMGVSVTDDGMTSVAFFDESGKLIDDWL